MATTDARSPRRLGADDAGVVALVGLAMAMFLTGLVYYEMGVGDAIAFKEQLQDASDASGFAAAVYHAKGMNMIVLVNLIMAAILAIIVVLRVLELLFGIVAAVVPAICWIPGLEWLCPLEGIADSGLEWTTSAAETMDPIVRTALMGLNDVSTAIAVGMPWVAMIKSGTVGPQYYSQVTSDKGGGTVMLSMSLIPDMTWIPAVNNASEGASNGVKGGLGLGTGEEGGSKTEGKRWGLPVQDGEYATLCDQAGQVVPDLLEWAINAAVNHNPNASPPSWLSWLNNFIGGVIGSWPQFFCDEAAMTGGQVASMVKDQAQNQCNSLQKSYDQCTTQIANAGTNPCYAYAQDAQGVSHCLKASEAGPCAVKSSDGKSTVGAELNGKKKFDMNGCMSDETNAINAKAAAAANETTGSSIKNSVTPKAVYAYAANGNDYMAIWSFAWGRFSDNEEAGVSAAEWGVDGKTKASPKPTHPTMLTKAEFYYAVDNPCKAPGQYYGTKGSSTLCGTNLNMPFWGDYADDAAWNPRWRARLRRVSPPMIPVGQMASSGLSSLIGDALNKGLNMIPSSHTPPNHGTGNPGSPGSGENNGGAGTDEGLSFITNFIQIGGGYADGAIAGEIEKAAGYLH